MIPALGTWASPDPLAVHLPGKADLNLYAYVSGRLLAATDPTGLDEETLTTEPGNTTDEKYAAEGNANNKSQSPTVNASKDAGVVPYAWSMRPIAPSTYGMSELDARDANIRHEFDVQDWRSQHPEQAAADDASVAHNAKYAGAYEVGRNLETAASVGLAAELAVTLALQGRNVFDYYRAQLPTTRAPAMLPPAVRPPSDDQIIPGYKDNPAGALVFEGHGSTTKGHSVMPQGTYLMVHIHPGLGELEGQQAAMDGTFAPGRYSVITPGTRFPSLVLHPPTDNQFIRPSSTVVTAPTHIDDLLSPGMGFCVWGACRTPGQ